MIEGVRKFAIAVKDRDIDLIASINPFEAACSILAKSMNEGLLKQVQSEISAKKVKISPEEARDLFERALRFKKERGRLPEITSQEVWERRVIARTKGFNV